MLGVKLVRPVLYNSVLKYSINKPRIHHSSIRTIIGIKNFRRNSASNAVTDRNDGSKLLEYDIELEKLKQEEKANSPEEDLHEKFESHFMYFVCAGFFLSIFPFFIFYGPMGCGDDEKWVTRESYRVLEERIAKGLPLVDPNFAPPDEIEKMIPPPGDWEKEWLKQQPTTKEIYRRNHKWQAPNKLRYCDYSV